MLKHIIFWTFKPDLAPAARQEILQQIAASCAAMKAQIPEVVEMEVGANLLPDGCDFVYYSVFRTQDDLERFLEHPLHDAHKARFAEFLDTRVLADYRALTV